MHDRLSASFSTFTWNCEIFAPGGRCTCVQMFLPFTVAVDESGRHGPNLTGGPHFALGSTSLDDAAAGAFLAETFGRRQGEWKWRYVLNDRHLLDRFLENIEAAKAKAVAIHHVYFGFTKAIDTTLYETAREEGRRDDDGSMQRRMVGLVEAAWKHVGRESEAFVSSFVVACRTQESDAFRDFTAEAYRLSEKCSELTTSILLRKVAQRVPLLAEYLSGWRERPIRPADLIDPHVCALGSICNAWRAEHGNAVEPFLVLHDEIHVGDVVDRWSRTMAMQSNATLVRGDSAARPSLQVADLVAGATEFAFRVNVRNGQSSLIKIRQKLPTWLIADDTVWPDLWR